MSFFDRQPSMRRKLVLMFLGTTIVLHFVIGEIAQHALKSHFYDLTTAALHKRFEGMSKTSGLDYSDPQTVSRFEKQLVNIWNIDNNQVNYQNTPIPLPSDPSNFFLTGKSLEYSKQWTDGSDHYLAISCYVNDKNTLVLGFNINHHIEFFQAIKTMIFWLTLAVGVLAGIYSIIIVNNGLRPLKRFESYLARIRPGNLDIRIPTKKLPIELETLGQVQNQMLDRLDLGFQRLSDFSSDIAHELRTPLTNITTQTQVALSNDRDADEYRDILGSNLEELERINKTINDTLYLAKAENSLLYQKREMLDLNSEIGQLIEYHSIVAEDEEIAIELNGSGELCVDKHMFQRAINNLLSNAIRHSSSGSTIYVCIEQSEDLVSITVANTGDTISKETLPFIFDRFYRGDCSRENDCGTGAGLGLAITKSIIETYDGTITAQSEDGITRFEMRFPRTEATS